MKRMCLAPFNRHHVMVHATCSKELISSNFGYGCCFPIWLKLLIGVRSLAKANIEQSILGG